MGLLPGILQQMIRLHKKRRFTGPVLTLGVLDIYANYDDVVQWCRTARFPIVSVPESERRLSTSRNFRGMGLEKRGFLHAATFFRALGLVGYEDLDFSEAEGPTLVHDLNEPVPPTWHGRFGLIVDAGTIEHVFDMRTVMTNIVNLLAVGGTA